MDHKKIADALWAAEKGSFQIDILTESYPEMTLKDAYQIQLLNVERRKKEGGQVIGMKIGLTSQGMQKLLGVNEPDYGHLFHDMLLPEGQPCSVSELIQPRVEGELTFCLKDTLRGPGITTVDVYNATAYVTPSIEIVDSRIKDWKIKLLDTVADNGSSAKLVLGGRMTLVENVDMRLTGMTLEKNGKLLSSGTTAEVWGSPAASVAWLANTLSMYGIELTAGSIIMAGAVTAAEYVKAGDVITASFHGMGSVSVSFE